MPITSAEAQLFYEGSSFMNLEFFFFFKRSLFLEQRVTSINKPKSRRYNPFNKRQPASLCRGGWAHSGLFIRASGRKGLLTQLLFFRAIIWTYDTNPSFPSGRSSRVSGESIIKIQGKPRGFGS